MFRLFAFGFGAALAWALVRQVDLPNGSRWVLVGGFIAAFVLAYFAGRARRPSAVATATATATAVAAAKANQAVVVNVAVGARHQAAEQFGHLDAVEWQTDQVAIEALDVDAVEDGALDAVGADVVAQPIR